MKKPISAEPSENTTKRQQELEWWAARGVDTSGALLKPDGSVYMLQWRLSVATFNLTRSQDSWSKPGSWAAVLDYPNAAYRESKWVPHLLGTHYSGDTPEELVQNIWKRLEKETHRITSFNAQMQLEIKSCRYVFEDTAGWWYWDESLAYRHGPWVSREIALQEQQKYVKSLNPPCGELA